MLFFYIYISIAIFTYLYFYHLTKDSINPFGISLSIFLAAFAISELKLNDMYVNASLQMHLCVLLVWIEIFIVGIFLLGTNSQALKKSNTYPVVTARYKFWMWTIEIVTLLGTIYLLKNSNTILSYEIAGTYDKKSAVTIMKTDSTIRYLATLFPYTPIFLFYDFLFGDNEGKTYKFVLLVLIGLAFIYTWFVLISRGTLMADVLGFLYLINKKKKINISFLGIFIMIFLAGFGSLMTLRVNVKSVVYQGATNNLIINNWYNYIAFNFVNFDKLLIHGSPYSGITYSWITVSKIFGIYDKSRFLNFQTSAFNARTFLYGFYHDLGLLGIILYPMVIFFIVGLIYMKSKTNKPQYILLLAILAKPIFVIFYGNYFFGSFSGDIQMLTAIFLIYLGYRKSTIVLTTNKYELLKL